VKWVLIASRIGPESFQEEEGKRGFGVCITYYFIGDFDGTTFRSETPALMLGAPDDYAAVSWSDAPDERRVLIGWMNHWGYAGDVPTKSEGWQGAMTLPREFTLRSGENGLRLLQNPVREVETLRGARHSIEAQNILPGESLTLEFQSDCCEIIAEFEPGAARECGLCVRVDEGESTVIGYDAVNKGIFVDRTCAGKRDFNPHFAGRYTAPLKLQDGLLKLRIFVDRSSVEVFANDGEACLIAQIFPSAGSRGIELFATGAACQLRAFGCYELKRVM
jgi:fructan beta-fructosidase